MLRASEEPAPATWSIRTFERVQAAVVYVAVEIDGPRGRFVIERPSSGVIVDASGLVVTWSRLVAEAAGASDKRVLVQLNDAGNTRLPADVVASDRDSGLTLLQVEPPADGLTAVPLGDSPQWGEPVLVVARPDGKDMLAFAGVASRSLGAVRLDGHEFPPEQVFLTDSRNDERCDGGAVFGEHGHLLGLYSSEHVQRNVSEPTLADLKRPSFGVVLAARRMARAFAARGLAVAPRDPHPWAEAVGKVAPAVVSIWSGDGDWPSATSDDPGCVMRREGLGSGVVLTADGLVVGNAHVVGDNPRVRSGGDTYAAEVLARDRRSNLALLRVALPAGVTWTPARFAGDDDVLLGETMLAVGNPLGTGVVVSGGVISAMREREGGRIQADANLGNANGGGAIIDLAGRVLGIGDAGRIDPIDLAWMMRGDGATQETNLSTFVGVRKLRRVFRRELAAAGAVLPAAPAAPSAEPLRHSPLTRLVAAKRGALLNIYVQKNFAEQDPDDPFPPDPIWRTLSLGSGVIIDRTGLAISNWHVVDDATHADGSSVADHKVTARVFGGREYEVEVLAISRENDLSLLRLELADGERVEAIELGSSERLRIGEAVAAIGNPHGRANTITYGVVSAKGKGIRVKGRWAKLNHLIETDAAINGGNSGGALLDMGGRLVGINSAGGGTFNNVGYAIAIDHVRRTITGLLLQPYKLRSVDLGMRVIDDDGRVVVMDVDPRGPAARAGVRSGDRITSLAGVGITWSPGFAMTLRAQRPGVEVQLVIERGGERRSLAVAPLAPEVWSVIRQAGLQVRELRYGEAPERVRVAAIELYRKFTGDATGAPQVIPERVVAVEKVFELAGERPPLAPG
ncbi:MAG TPA: serine protease, partial [bacterium]|nr:serine protease [bacterium]